MNRKAQERVGMLIEQFIDNLNRESKQLGVSERWFFNRHPNLQFSVVEKAMPGMLFYDGKQMPEGEVRKKGGQKHLDHGGPTGKQLEIMEASSKNDMEFLHRLSLLIFEKKDTTASVVTHGVDMAQIEKLIEQKAKEKAVEILQEMRAQELGTQEALAKAARESVEPPKGLVKRTVPQERKALKNQIVEVWTKRAELLGIGPPTITKHGIVHEAWLKHVRPQWAKYIETNPEADKMHLHDAQKPEASVAT